jgi:hypothetical protein
LPITRRAQVGGRRSPVRGKCIHTGKSHGHPPPQRHLPPLTLSLLCGLLVWPARPVARTVRVFEQPRPETKSKLACRNRNRSGCCATGHAPDAGDLVSSPTPGPRAIIHRCWLVTPSMMRSAACSAWRSIVVSNCFVRTLRIVPKKPDERENASRRCYPGNYRDGCHGSKACSHTGLSRQCQRS